MYQFGENHFHTVASDNGTIVRMPRNIERIEEFLNPKGLKYQARDSKGRLGKSYPSYTHGLIEVVAQYNAGWNKWMKEHDCTDHKGFNFDCQNIRENSAFKIEQFLDFWEGNLKDKKNGFVNLLPGCFSYSHMATMQVRDGHNVLCIGGKIFIDMDYQRYSPDIQIYIGFHWLGRYGQKPENEFFTKAQLATIKSFSEYVAIANRWEDTDTNDKYYSLAYLQNQYRQAA